jgi:lipoprotein NlpI
MSLKCLLFLTASLSLALAPGPGYAGKSSKQLLEAARRALVEGEMKRALDLADKTVALNPKEPRAYLLRGQARDALGFHREAVEDFSRALELDPKLAEALDRRGSSHFKLGEFARSLADFDRYLAARPEEKAGHWRRGITCYYAKRYDKGRKQFEAYEQKDTNDVENAVWRYLCMVPLVGVEKARVAMLKIGQDTRVPLMVVYDLFRGRAKPADVLKAVEEGKPPAGELTRRRFYAHLYLGLYYESLGDAKRAREHLTTATEHRISASGGPGYMWDVARVHRDLLRKTAKP